MKRSILSDERGFSLVELIVVVVILGILSGGLAVSISVVTNADAERAAKSLQTILLRARTEAVENNEENETSRLKTEYVAVIEQRENGDYYASVKKKTTPFTVTGGVKTYGTPSYSEPIVEKKLSSYRVNVYFGEKNSDITNEASVTQIQKETETIKETIEYSFSRGTGRATVGKCTVTNPGGGSESLSFSTVKYYDIYLVGSETYKIVISNASGVNHIEEQ